MTEIQKLLEEMKAHIGQDVEIRISAALVPGKGGYEERANFHIIYGTAKGHKVHGRVSTNSVYSDVGQCTISATKLGETADKFGYGVLKVLNGG